MMRTKLRKVSQIYLRPVPPFAFDPTFHKPDHFPSGDNAWRPGVRWQTWHWRGQHLGLKFQNHGSVRRPRVAVGVYAQKKLNQDFLGSLSREIRYRYNLDLDLSDFYRTFRRDRILGPRIRRWRGMRPGHAGSLYEYLIIGVVLQNATVRRSVQMLQALFENYGQLLAFDRKELWCFWEPGSLAAVRESALRALKLGYRAKFIREIDRQFAAGAVDEEQLRVVSRDTLRETLLKLYGVGPATAWYLLHDVFHRWDFFDHVSPWEQKIYSKVFFDRDPERPLPAGKLLKYFARYRPYQQLAVHYVWEDLWWRRKKRRIPWLEALIRT